MKRPARVTGGDKIQSQLKAYEHRLVPAVQRAVNEHALDVLAAADGALSGPGPLVPVDLGILRNSGTITPAKVSGDRVVGEVGYGGPAAPYAVAVHERVEEGVNWSRPGSGPKFLENAMNYLSRHLIPRIRDAVKRETRLGPR